MTKEFFGKDENVAPGILCPQEQGKHRVPCYLVLTAPKLQRQHESPSETARAISVGRLVGRRRASQTQSYVKEKTHHMENQWTKEVAPVHGFDICQCRG